jgi:hypothetical protein
MLLREMEINGGFLQIAMSQQNLDGPQIRAVLEQVSGETVSQRVRMNLLADAGTLGGFPAGLPDDLGGDRMIGGVPAVAGKQPDGGCGSSKCRLRRESSVVPPG